MDELIDQTDNDFNPETVDTQEGFNQGFNYATPDEQDEIVASASNAHKPSIIVTPGQGIAYENMDAAPDRFQAFYESTLNGKHKLDKSGYESCLRAFCNEVNYNPEYSHLDKGGKAKRIKEMASAYGLAEYLFQDSTTPQQDFDDFTGRIIQQSIANSPPELSKIVANTIQGNSMRNQLRDAQEQAWKFAQAKASMDNIVSGLSLEGMDKGAATKYYEAIQAELMLRVQDDLAAWLQDNPNATDAERFAVIRDSAAANVKQVTEDMASNEDYMTTFANKRKADTEDRARLFHQQYLDAKTDMQPLKKAGEDMRVVQDTREAEQNAIENYKKQEANKTARENFKTENNLGGSKPRKQYVAETTSYPFYIGVSKQYANEPPCIIVPEEEYAAMCADMQVGEGDGLMMDIGTKANPERVPVRPGKVTKPRMNIPLANRKYVNGKKKQLRADQFKAAEQGVRYTVRFIKTSKKK